MSLTPSVGMLVKISPDVIPETAKDDELLGDLGIPGLMRHAIFEIVKLDKDATRGDIAYCRITNPDVFKEVIPGVKEVKYEGELVLLIKDIVPANTRVTLDYVINTSKTKDELVAELFKERKAMQNRGVTKTHPSMRANWKEIQILRGEVAGVSKYSSGTTTVTLTKQRITLELNASEIPSNDEESIKKFKQLLSNKLRGVRAQRRSQKLESKQLFGIMTVQKSAGVYLQPNSLLKAYEEMMKTTLETDKKPTDAKANYVGIEIEMVYSGNYDALKRELISAKLHRNVCIKDDGSLRACHNGGGYQTKELTLLCKSTEVEDVLKRLDSVLSHPEIDAYANRSCGLHVHLDIRNRKAGLVYTNLVRIQNILRGAQPVGRIKNTHCRANTSDKLESQQDGGGGNRYWVVNGQSVSRHSSIEVRIHEGTTDCEAIYNWVTFLNAIADHKVEIPKNEVKFAEDLVGKFNIDIPLEAIDYVDRRIERFKSLTAAPAASF